ncbi:hypothetical protein VM1G_06389 [Cytospora mali]|uniref:HNH nuclease domain-containing protein n=1 Tax=Cytospora mali TaxID=578113 RepID=A0A194W364_CYTMA|nr:hypothetical protein VM1G_06389 [Valsa mali]
MPTSVRPPSLPPSSATARPRVCLRHPGYGDLSPNILLVLPAVDSFDEPVSAPSHGHSAPSIPIRPGLHHRTVLTAGAIIANNAFDRAYLTRDQAGRVVVTTPLDGMLEPGNYWLQLRGNEPPLRADQTADTLGAERRHEDGFSIVTSSMPPPTPPAYSDPSTRSPQTQTPHTHTPSSTSPSSSPAPHMPTRYKPYPVVPSFRDWRFPHDRLPPEWKSPHHAPPQLSGPSAPAPHTNSPAPTPSEASSKCCITGYRMARKQCHLIPANQYQWFADNGMYRYASSIPGQISDKANIAFMRADIHLLFDQRRFAILPKPISSLTPTPSPSSSPLGRGSDPGSYAFAAHVLKDDEESGEFCDLYHNVAAQRSGINKLGREFLFARFAWTLFSHLQPFLESSTRRYIAITTRDETESRCSTTQLKWMNNKEWVECLTSRGEICDGSRKRTSSQVTRDEDLETDDAYQERWDLRSHSLESAHAYLDNLDPEERQIEENTMWYNEVGQYAADALDDNPDMDCGCLRRQRDRNFRRLPM